MVIAGGLALASAINLGGLMLWVRLLPPAAFGTLSLVGGAALMLNALGFEWLRLAGARSLIDPQATHGISLARLAAWLQLAALVAAALATLTVVATLSHRAAPGLTPGWNLAILLLVLSEMPFAAMTLVARLRFAATTYAFAMIARAALALIGGLFLLRAGGGALAIVAATALAQLAVTVGAVARDPLWRTSFSHHPTRADRADLVRLGAPLIASAALALAAATADRYLVAHFLGIEAAGRYAAPAELVAKTLGFVLMAINLSAYPILVRSWERDGPAATARALDRNLALLLGAALPILVAFTLFPTALAAIMLGRGSLPLAAALLPWLAAATLLRLLVSFHFAVALQLAKRMTLLVVPPLVTLALLVPLAAPVIAEGGLLGLARLLAVAQGAGTISAWLLARRVLRQAGSPRPRPAPRSPPRPARAASPRHR
ncbi:MAG: hypothetical protein ABIR77_05140 [Sphingomicrobium sp.]